MATFPAPAATVRDVMFRRRSRRRFIEPLYPAHRLDWNRSHAIAAVTALTHRNPVRAEAAILDAWGTADAMAFLSVRSALAALLESVNWPRGSEILVSGVNIGDIPKIIRSFGHVVVPIDIDPSTLACSMDELKEKLNDNTRAVIVAHLFGGCMDVRPLIEFARVNRLLLIEDCAQRYTTRRALEPRLSDVRLFSFGLLKTGTALGGAIAEVGDRRLRNRMHEVQRSWRRQRRTTYAGKIAKSCLFLGVQQPVAYRFFAEVCKVAGSSSGAVLRKLTRGFGGLDGDALLQAFRCQSSAPLLRMLAWRLAHEDGERVGRRALAGERLHYRLGAMSGSAVLAIGAAQANRTHWLVPIFTKRPDILRMQLADAGFDAYGASNVIAVGGKRATEMIDGLVFLPCYPEMSGRTRDRIAAVVEQSAMQERTAQ